MTAGGKEKSKNCRCSRCIMQGKGNNEKASHLISLQAQRKSLSHFYPRKSALVALRTVMLCYAMLYNAYASAGSAASCSTGWDCSWACNQQSSSCFNISTPSHPTPGEWVSCCFCLSSHREISCSAPPPHSSLGHPIGCHPFPKSPSLP